MASGILSTKPKIKTSSNGNLYSSALMRVATDQGYFSVSLIAFKDAGKLLGALDANDQITVSGKASPNEWEQDGEKRLGLFIVADQVMTAYNLRKKQTRIKNAIEEDTDPNDDISYI